MSRVPPILAAAIAAVGSNTCTQEMLDAAILEGRSPDTAGWFALALAAAHEPADVRAIETGWGMCSEASRTDLLDVVLSRRATPWRQPFDARASRLLVGLAGQRRMEVLADTLVQRAWSDGPAAMSPTMTALDSFTKDIQDPSKWARFCLVRRRWDACDLPLASAILEASRHAVTLATTRPPRASVRRVRS